jgi:type IV secretion/conjugal transfer VirB4 family ATPase
MKETTKLKDLVPYFCFLDDDESIIYNKNDSIQMTLKITYRNLDFESEELQVFIFSKINEAIKKLDYEDFFTVYFELQRKRILLAEELRENIPPPTKRIFMDQQIKFNEKYKCYMTENYITINFNIKKFHRIKNLMSKIKMVGNNKNLEEKIQQDFSKQISFFNDKIHEFLSQIEPVTLDVEIVKGEELQAFLLSQVTSDFNKRIFINDNNSLDEFLSLSEFEIGKKSKINGEYVACVAFVTFPDTIRMRVLKELESLNFPFRYVVKFRVEKQSKLHFRFKQKRKIYNLLTKSPEEVISQTKSEYEDGTAREQANEVHEAMNELKGKKSVFGQLTSTIIIKDKNHSRLQEKVNAVKKIASFNGFWCKDDTLNTYHSYFGAMAGNNELNKRTGLTASTSLLCMVSTSTPFLGFQYNECLREHALMQALTDSEDIYNFNLHVGDVGHTLIVGPTGAGKSVLLGLIASQFMRYKNARVIFFDKNRSSEVLCRCSGGQFYDIGSDFSFQIMEKINDEKYKSFVREWLFSIADLEKEELSIEEKNLITDRLNLLASKSEEERTFTGFMGFLTNNRLKRIYENYVSGTYQKYFNREKKLEKKNFVVYEMDSILKDTKLVNFILSYLFFTIEHEMLDGNPTLILIDEAWVSLNNEYMKKQIEEWLRELRKKNASVVFATQSLSEIDKSSLAPVIIESCKTKIMLPNEVAFRIRDLYGKIGLNEEEIDKVRNALPKKEYFVKNEIGSALIRFELGKEAIYYVGSNHVSDVEKIKEICKETNNTNEINQKWLDYKEKEV